MMKARKPATATVTKGGSKKKNAAAAKKPAVKKSKPRTPRTDR